MISAIFNLLGRGTVTAWSDGDRPRAQVAGLHDELLDGREVFQDYGFASHPLAGAAAFFGCLFGRRTKAIVLRTPDRRYRIALAEGEVAVHDDQGQRVHLTREGIDIETALRLRLMGRDVEIHASRSLLTSVGGYAEKLTHVSEGNLVREIWHEPALVTDEPDHGYPLPAEGS